MGLVPGDERATQHPRTPSRTVTRARHRSTPCAFADMPLTCERLRTHRVVCNPLSATLSIPNTRVASSPSMASWVSAPEAFMRPLITAPIKWTSQVS